MAATYVPVKYKNLLRKDAFELVDQHSSKISRDVFLSPDELIKNLFFSSSFDKVMKIRSIFTWLSLVDVNKLEYHCDKDVEICNALNCLKFGGSYAEAFFQLASFIGVKTVCIKGWAKGCNFMEHDMSQMPANHSWNAVEIQMKWFLIDCYWSKSISEDGKPEIDDFYFFVDPKDMIYSHYPECPKWQLLPEIITYESFIELPAFKSDFFKLKLKVKDYVVRNGLAQLTLNFEGNIFFKFKIDKVGRKLSYCHGLKHLVFEVLHGNNVTYLFQAPESGTYILKIFASTIDYSFKQNFVIYKEVANFKIITKAYSFITPLPLASDACWGICEPYSTYISPQMIRACIFSEGGGVNFDITKISNKIFFLKISFANSTKASSLTFVEKELEFNIAMNIECWHKCGIEIYVADIHSPKKFYFAGQLICFNNNFVNRKFYSDILNCKDECLTPSLEPYEFTKLREIFLLATKGIDKDFKYQHILLNKFSSAHVFEQLCRLHNYGCVTISGVIKDTYSGKDKFQHLKAHLWNAVFFKDSWHLIDCELARKRTKDVMWLSNVEDYYFLPDPKEIIYTHFPFDPKWQLLEYPITLRAYKTLANIKPKFFMNNLSLVQPTCSYLEVNYDTNIVLKQTSEVDLSYSFSFIFLDNPQLELDRYLMYYFKDDLIIFNLRFPLRGMYQLILLTKNMDSGCEDTFEEICDFMLDHKGNDGHVKSFPGSSSFCGPTNFAKKNKIRCNYTNPLIETFSGFTSLSICTTSELKFYLEFTNHDGETINGISYKKIDNNIEIMVRCPKTGEYCLKVFAAKVEDSDSSVCLAFNMCVVFHNISSACNAVFPDIFLWASFGFLGPQLSNAYFGVIYLGDSDIILGHKENFVALRFLDGLNLNLSCKLCKVNSESADFSAFVLKQRSSHENNFLISLPMEGVYVFQLFGNKNENEHLNIYNIIIDCRVRANQTFEFPKQMGAWDGFLHKPLQKYLIKSKSTVEFLLELHSFVSVYLVTENASIPFAQINDGFWRLDADLFELPVGCRVTVSACRFHKLYELLEFRIT